MNQTEQYRRECEARYVLAMDKVKREVFYKGVLGKRGLVRAQQLVDDVNKARKVAKGAKG